MEAVDGSLRRLQTDCIDLYQLHWPDRYTNFFGQRGYFTVNSQRHRLMRRCVLQELVAAGKIKTIGLSNETPWGP